MEGAAQQLDRLNACLADLLPRSEAQGELSQQEGARGRGPRVSVPLAAGGRARATTRRRERPRRAPRRCAGRGAPLRHRAPPTPVRTPPPGRAVADKARQLVEAAAEIQRRLAAFAAAPAPTVKGRLQQARWGVGGGAREGAGRRVSLAPLSGPQRSALCSGVGRTPTPLTLPPQEVVELEAELQAAVSGGGGGRALVLFRLAPAPARAAAPRPTPRPSGPCPPLPPRTRCCLRPRRSCGGGAESASACARRTPPRSPTASDARRPELNNAQPLLADAGVAGRGGVGASRDKALAVGQVQPPPAAKGDDGLAAARAAGCGPRRALDTGAQRRLRRGRLPPVAPLPPRRSAAFPARRASRRRRGRRAARGRRGRRAARDKGGRGPPARRRRAAHFPARRPRPPPPRPAQHARGKFAIAARVLPSAPTALVRAPPRRAGRDRIRPRDARARPTGRPRAPMGPVTAPRPRH
jgi:hypothetical protein